MNLKSSFEAWLTPKTLDELLEDLARARQSLDQFKAAQDELDAEWKLARAEAVHRVEAAAATCDAIEVKVRERTVAEFNRTGIKKVHQNAWVREVTTLDYDDEDALEYCRENLPGALKLDRRGFEKVAKAIPDFLDFVTKGTRLDTSISRDLSGLLEQADLVSAEHEKGG